MNLTRLVDTRLSSDGPVRAGLIGAGKFGTMFLAQAKRTRGLTVAAIADRDPERAQRALAAAGWPADRRPAILDDGAALCAHGDVEVVIEATGHPPAGIAHCRAAYAAGRPVVMVTVEADALCGPLLAEEAREAGTTYSLAWGDQPALICDLVDWARAAGFAVIAAGKGTKYLPSYHASTPETVWQHYGIAPADAARGGMNPQMFNSFLDGTKSAIEMAAVSNATGLEPAPGGLMFPATGTRALAATLRPQSDGGVLDAPGRVEVISSLARDGSPIADDLRWGVYVVVRADDDYVRNCFREYGLATDDTGRYASMYKPYHLIGLELGISVLNVALRGEPTGAPDAFRADVVAVAKRDLAAGTMLDGEGGYCVWGRLMPAADSLTAGALPLALAQGTRLERPVAAGDVLGYGDVALDADLPALVARREMERRFRPGAIG